MPYDGVPNPETDKVAVPLAVVVYLLAVAGIVFALVCFAFNFAFRKTR